MARRPKSTSRNARTSTANDDRKSRGVFYTPPAVVEYIVRETLGRYFAAEPHPVPNLLDPACGDGAFLIESARQLRTRFGDVAASGIYGVELDAAAAETARQRLALPTRNIRVGDAIVDDPALVARPFVWRQEFAQLFSSRGGFDVIVGNPPYVNMRELTRVSGEPIKAYLRSRYGCAHRAFDAYVLFVELAFELLRPGGWCGLIVPNKLATLDYARPCRELLARETTISLVTDVSGENVFPDASVYPYILVWQKRPPPWDHRFAVTFGSTTRLVPQARLSSSGWNLHGELDVESRVPTRPLGELAQLHSGTTGFVASQIADALREQTSGFAFITSGNIDRYAIRDGGVRFMQRRFSHPRLPFDCELLSDRKRRLFAGPKLVVSGMGKRLEAAFDPGGLALGVQVFAAADCTVDPGYLLGLLNSRLLSHLFRLRFQAKRLSGGFLSVNKRQLAALPIRVDGSPIAERIGNIARQLTRQFCPRLDAELDRLVYAHYELTDAEVAEVDSVSM